MLFRFSDAAGAARATERAFLAAGQDKHELAATVLEAAQRAFLRKDVAGARAAVGRGLSAELDDDDFVYAALWLLFTEKDAKARTDGTATRALASIRDDGRWPSRLAQWGLGKLKDADLVAAARFDRTEDRGRVLHCPGQKDRRRERGRFRPRRGGQELGDRSGRGAAGPRALVGARRDSPTDRCRLVCRFLSP